MNQVLILLLVTLVQSQSDGVLLATPNSNEMFRTSPLEDLEEPPYSGDVIKDYDLNPESYKKRSITSDSFSRRSALDKNFMRFGRGKKDAYQDEDKDNFYRSIRALKDNFIRFGRARDNFIRFGRGGGKDGFIRFGRTRPEDFFRAGKSLRENFIRFGKADKNFLRFGRPDSDTEEEYQDILSADEPFQRLEKSTRNQDNFMRFGKNGKNGTNFLRFGKSESETEEPDEGSSQEPGPKRKKREAELPEKTNRKRAIGYFDIPPDFPRRISPMLDGSWQNLEKLKNSRLTPFFPVFSNFPKNLDNYGAEEKRNNGGSNFIRFG